jgi:hypothetical protein
MCGDQVASRARVHIDLEAVINLPFTRGLALFHRRTRCFFHRVPFLMPETVEPSFGFERGLELFPCNQVYIVLSQKIVHVGTCESLKIGGTPRRAE